MPLKDLEDSLRILQGGVLLHRPRNRARCLLLEGCIEAGVVRLTWRRAGPAGRGALLLPATGVVRLRLVVPSGEKAVEVLGVAIVRAHQGGSVGVVEDVV